MYLLLLGCKTTTFVEQYKNHPMNVVKLTTCNDSIEANLMKTRLEDSDIACFLTNENFSNLMPHYNRIMDSGVQVMINEADIERARELLQLNKQETLTCPQCGSTNIKMGLGANKIKKILSIIILSFSSGPSNNIKYECKCQQCYTKF